MIYLKRFNEKLTDEQLESLKDFCDNCFAYLYDEGFNLSVTTKLITPDRDTQFALANTFTANYKTNWDEYTSRTTPVRIYTIKLYGSCFEFSQVKDSLIVFLTLLERNNVQVFRGFRFKGLSHYSYNPRTLNGIEEELYKVPGMYHKHPHSTKYEKDQMTLTSIEIDLLEYDLSRAQIIN
jgi:hypothetical protein